MILSELIEELKWMSKHIGKDAKIQIIKQDGLCIFSNLDNKYSIIFVDRNT